MSDRRPPRATPQALPSDLGPPFALIARPGDLEGPETDWAWFARPSETVECDHPEQIPAALDRIAEACRRGAWACGFVTYEGARGFDSAFSTHDPQTLGLPALWFGLFDGPIPFDAASSTSDGDRLTAPGKPPELDWQPTISADEHRVAIGEIHHAIARGDTYQANFTFPFVAPWPGVGNASERPEAESERTDGDDSSRSEQAFQLFRSLYRVQRSSLAAYIDLGRHVICSASPELFFERQGDRLRCRPMKGTRPRGRTTAEDATIRRQLGRSAKDRAENLMIVDMMRNDLGRIAEPGSVHVPELFRVERYPTVFQMTSTVEARSKASFREIFQALFPCASITGAPKIRTMEILHRLETGPRGIYCGAIGLMAPDGNARFSVAIRTAHLDRSRQQARYGTGGGIVWDSTAEGEFAEAETKTKILFQPQPPFELLETIGWSPRLGFRLLGRHLHRMADSASYFGRPFSTAKAHARLEALAATLPARHHRLRLWLAENGGLRIEAEPQMRGAPRVWSLRLAQEPVDSSDPFLFHKTSRREVYQRARLGLDGADDVLLWNERGEATETTIANLVARRGGEFVTPALSCGLLPGTFRQELLERGRLREAILPIEELAEADALYLINSVRGWIRARLLLSSSLNDSRHSLRGATPAR